MACEARHKAQTITEGLHSAISFEYADETARLAGGPFESFDKYKLALQTDDNSVWLLVDEVAETWVQVTVTSSSIDHGSISGLLDDDHPQYLLVDGTRAMSGDLDMDGYDILNVGLIDGVDILNHASRHEFGGADAIELSNIGTSENDTTLVLKPDGAGGVSWVADQVRDLDGYVFETRQLIAGDGLTGGGDLSADRTFNVVANADGSIVVNANDIQVGVLATDAQHGNRGGGSLHAVATTSVAGFMSASDKTKLDGIDAATTITISDATAGVVGTNTTYAREDHKHQVDTTGTLSIIDAGDTANDGTASGLARKDHQHAVSTGTASAISVGDTASEGTSTNLARADHGHTLTAGTPVAIGNANATGSSGNFVHSDHVHQLGGTVGGDLSGTLPNPTVTDLTIAGEQQGSVLYFDGTNWVQLPPGTDGYVLSTQGVGADPQWVDVDSVGAGDVIGPASSTDNALVRFDGTSGKFIQNSNAILTDAGALTLTLGLTVGGDIDVGGNNITNVNLVDGVDVSDHASRHEFGGADTIEIANLSTSETDTTLVLKPDGAGSVSWVVDQVRDLDGYVFEDRQVIAGAGLVGGGDLSSDRTFDVVANADGSIVVNANDIQVGTLANDAQHGDLGGGSLHELADSTQNGFFSIDGYNKLEGIETGAQVNTVDSVFGRTGAVISLASDYDASQIDNDSGVPGVFVDDALDYLDGYIGSVATDFDSHADRHEFGGADQIDGYELELTYSAINYNQPTNDKLGEHIAAIDDALVSLDTSLTNVYYVDQNGSDVTGDGSVSNPFATVSQAMTAIGDASTTLEYEDYDQTNFLVKVAPGDYVENVTIPRRQVIHIELQGTSKITGDITFTADTSLGGSDHPPKLTISGQTRRPGFSGNVPIIGIDGNINFGSDSLTSQVAILDLHGIYISGSIVCGSNSAPHTQLYADNTYIDGGIVHTASNTSAVFLYLSGTGDRGPSSGIGGLGGVGLANAWRFRLVENVAFDGDVYATGASSTGRMTDVEISADLYMNGSSATIDVDLVTYNAIQNALADVNTSTLNILDAHASYHESGGVDEIDGYQLAIVYAPTNYVTPTSDILGQHLFEIDEQLGIISSSIITDHGSLTGLGDDDHTQYLLVDGTRAMSGNLDMGTNSIINVGTVDGVDVSAHAARHENGGADEINVAGLSGLLADPQTPTTHAGTHISAGSDEIDGDQVDIDWNPSNYTPSTTPTEVSSVDHLTAHLYGIDQELGNIITDHGNLAGLGDDDHAQYLLVDGTRAMSGDLDMGANDITDVTGIIIDAPNIDAIQVDDGGTLRRMFGFRDSDQTLFIGNDNPTSGTDEHKYEAITQMLWEISGSAKITVTSTTTTFGNPLDMGSNSITNVNLVDGVDVSNHGTRHDPGGADPITTAAATGLDADSTNTEGTATSLARSDHTHAIDTTGTLSTIDAGDTSSDGVSSGLARKDHQHGVSTGAASAISVGDTASEGTSTNLARADHGHTLTAAAPVAIGDSNQTGSSGNFVHSDHVHQLGGTVGGDLSGTLPNPTVTDLTITSEEQGSVLYFDGSNWVQLPPGEDGYALITKGTGADPEWGEVATSSVKRTVTVEFTLTEDVNNTIQWFTTWRSHGGDSPGNKRSGTSVGIQNPNTCSPYQVPFDATIIKAILTLKGAGVQNGSVSYPVTYQTDLYEEGFTSETKIDDIDFSISNSFTVGTFSPANTHYTGNVDLDIDVDEAQLLALKFINGTGANLVGQSRNAFITLILEER